MRFFIPCVAHDESFRQTLVSRLTGLPVGTSLLFAGLPDAFLECVNTSVPGAMPSIDIRVVPAADVKAAVEAKEIVILDLMGIFQNALEVLTAGFDLHVTGRSPQSPTTEG